MEVILYYFCTHSVWWPVIHTVVCEFELFRHPRLPFVFQIWKYPCAQVIFDSDPAPTGRSVPAQIEEMSQAMIRFVHMNLERCESKVRVTCD